MDDLWTAVQQTAHRDPKRIAVAGIATLTYEQLHRRVSEATGTLARSCGPGDVVALACSSLLDGLVYILATQAIKAVFLPLDLTAPRSRTDHILKVARARMLISDTESGTTRCEVLTGGSPALRRPDRAGYLIFTSGSTGTPKGVHVSGAALLDRLAGLAARPGFTEDDSFLAMTPMSFDISLAELLLPVVAGGRVIVAPPAARRDLAALEQVLQTFRPDVIQATPAFWRLLIAAGWKGAHWASIWCGGEQMTSQLAGDLLSRSEQLWNVYGPTEATIWATAGRVESPDDVDLGKPLPDTGLAVLSPEGQLLVQPGSEGEIVLWGAGLAEGYLGDSADDAFFTTGTPPRPCYRTGDRAFITREGKLCFLGRSDTQIKLRGHRIELGEIEAVLEQLPGVVDAVVFPKDLDTSDGGYLVACVTVRDAGLRARDVRRSLLERLPAIMVPRHVGIFEELPRSTSGKLDRPRIQREWQTTMTGV